MEFITFSNTKTKHRKQRSDEYFSHLCIFGIFKEIMITSKYCAQKSLCIVCRHGSVLHFFNISSSSKGLINQQLIISRTLQKQIKKYNNHVHTILHLLGKEKLKGKPTINNLPAFEEKISRLHSTYLTRKETFSLAKKSKIAKIFYRDMFKQIGQVP